jgi:hypothetical protein
MDNQQGPDEETGADEGRGASHVPSFASVFSTVKAQTYRKSAQDEARRSTALRLEHTRAAREM